MRAMFRALRPYMVALLVTWLALGIAADIYVHKYPAQSYWITRGLFPAFLFESIFFLAAGFEQARELFARIKLPFIQSTILWSSSVVPYLIVSATSGLFDSHALFML